MCLQHREDTTDRAKETAAGAEIRNRKTPMNQAAAGKDNAVVAATCTVHGSDVRILGIASRLSKSGARSFCANLLST